MSFDTTTNLLTLSNEPFPTQQPPSSSAASTTANDAKHVSKLILRSALQKANVAVQCDSTNDVLGAINAYREAISLLDSVLSTVEKENDRRRLQEIHDSYSERIRLLSTITSKMDSDNVKAEPVIRSMKSSSSLNSKPSAITTSKRSQQSTPSSPRPVSDQKEAIKIPVSPPIIQMVASKSTPTHPLQHHHQSPFHKEQAYSDNESETEPSPSSVIRPPPKHQDRRCRQNSKGTTSTTSSLNSMSPSCSSSEEEDEEERIVEQPAMVLPSLKKKDQDSTPIPKLRSVFRARTSSLPKPPLVQISSSMSTVDTIANSTAAVTEETLNPQIPVAAVAEKTPLTLPMDVTPTSTSQPYPPQMIINRPIISRPSVGGLGSMRKKAANRLSMEGFAVGRVKEKLSNSPGNHSYGFFLKDQIKPTSAGELDYIMDDQSQQLQQTEDNHPSSMTRSSSLDDTSIMEDKQSHLKLLLALEKSMLEGAHITQKLYIPKNLWQQPNIRLSSMDIKVSACESLMHDIAQLENWSYLDDLVSSTRLLEHFETSVDQLQTNLSKKLKRESTLENSSNSSNSSSHSNNSASIQHRDSMSTISRIDSGKRTQSFMSWGTKLTKSVERMNAFSLTKTEDQYKNYIEALQKLFSKIHVLENWLHHYSMEKKKSRQPQHDILLMKLVKICTVINNVIGGFVVRDITVLLAKWLKRGGSWVNE